MKLRLTLFLLALLLALMVGSSLLPLRQPRREVAEEPMAPFWFEDVAKAKGLNFTHDAGPVGYYFMPQSIGSGAALFDFDGDGLLDVYLLNNGGPQGRTNRLYKQQRDGTFQDVSVGSGLDVAGWSMGVAIGDVNNDGLPDVLLTQYGAIRLFLNNGNGRFTEVTQQAGLHSPLWAVSASFIDYDRDGWLDLVVVNYVDYDPTARCTDAAGVQEFCATKAFKGVVSKLFRNGGAVGTGVPKFTDVTLSSGLGRKPGSGLGVVCADFNGDGWPDIFVANDGVANHLWINQKDGTFKDEAIQRGLAYNRMGQGEANMGVAVGDVDGDGLFDVFVTHLTTETHTLWKQSPRGVFRDETTTFGLSWPRWRATGWGTVLADFDHDGFADLALVSGGVARSAAQSNPELGPFWKDYAQRNGLFRNEDGKRFADLELQDLAFCGTPRVSRGLAVGDIDNDGSLDLLVTEIAGPVHLYRNVAEKRGRWVMIRAVDPRLKRDAYGAEVLVQAGGKRFWRLVQPGSSYACSNDPRVHVGLGNVDRIDAIEVLWPDGLRETFPPTAVDRHILLRRGDGRSAGKS